MIKTKVVFMTPVVAPIIPTSSFEDLVGDITRQVERELGLTPGPSCDIFSSPEAELLKGEIVLVGRKLWERNYVDGAGGNISVRIDQQYVLCTPTMLSKRDLSFADICMTDLSGTQVHGSLPRTSELQLHLAIYRANPAARAVVHCHPPHATVYAIAGVSPPTGYAVEHELFVGEIPVVPYETPGTMDFAKTPLPYVNDHNVVLLANHGIVCWADTATHAEWLVEIVDNYCRMLILASHIGVTLQPIPAAKVPEILALKRKLKYPDPLMRDPVDLSAPPKGGTRFDTAPGIRPDTQQIVRAVLQRVSGGVYSAKE
jgi:L-fuculose-phosphate aldolase